MSIQVVASVQSREFLLATLDHKIECAKVSRDRHRATADQAVIDGAPIMEQYALTCAQANSDALDWLLDSRNAFACLRRHCERSAPPAPSPAPHPTGTGRRTPLAEERLPRSADCATQTAQTAHSAHPPRPHHWPLHTQGAVMTGSLLYTVLIVLAIIALLLFILRGRL